MASLGTSLKGLGDDPDLRVATYNGGLAYFDLFEKGNLAIVPTHFFQVGREMADGNLKTDVAFLHVAPPDADGNYNLGPSVGYGCSAMATSVALGSRRGSSRTGASARSR